MLTSDDEGVPRQWPDRPPGRRWQLEPAGWEKGVDPPPVWYQLWTERPAAGV